MIKEAQSYVLTYLTITQTLILYRFRLIHLGICSVKVWLNSLSLIELLKDLTFHVISLMTQMRAL